MGVFHVFKIVQIVPNRATHDIFAKNFILDVLVGSGWPLSKFMNLLRTNG